jgi:hypothetical protein
MADTLYALTQSQVERLARLLQLVESGELSVPRGQRSEFVSHADRGISGFLTSAAVGTSSLNGTPTVGTLNVYGFSSTGTWDSGRDETVYNFAPTDATTDRWTVCHRDSYTGKWVIHTQYCS